MSIELPKPRYHYMSLLCFYISTAYDCFSGKRESVCSRVQTEVNSGKSIQSLQKTGRGRKDQLLKLCHDHGGSSGYGCAWEGASGIAQA